MEILFKYNPRDNPSRNAEALQCNCTVIVNLMASWSKALHHSNCIAGCSRL